MNISLKISINSGAQAIADIGLTLDRFSTKDELSAVVAGISADIAGVNSAIAGINSLNLWIPKNAQATKAAIVTAYPTPAKNWAATALDDGYIYVNDGLGALAANWINSGQKVFPTDVATKTYVDGNTNNLYSLLQNTVKEYNIKYTLKGYCVAAQAAPAAVANDVYYYTGATTATVFGITNVMKNAYLVYDGAVWKILYLQFALEDVQLSPVLNSYYDSAGVLTTYASFTSARVDISETDILYYSGSLKNTVSCAVAYFNAANALISRQHIADSSSIITVVENEFLVIPSGTKWIGLTGWSSTIPVLKKASYYNKATMAAKIIDMSSKLDDALFYKNIAATIASPNTYYNASGVLTTYPGLHTARYNGVNASDLLYYSGNIRNAAIAAAEFFTVGNVLISRQHVAESTSVDHVVTDEKLIIPFGTSWIGITSYGTPPTLKIGSLYSNGKVAQKIAEIESKVQPGWYGKKWLALGNSVTALNLYTPQVVSKLGLASVNNLGVSGSVVGTYANISGTPISPAVLNASDLITFCCFINNNNTYNT